MYKRFRDMRNELEDIALKESTRLWRLARRAKAHNVSDKVVNEIREEGHIMYTTMTSYPERLLAWDFKYNYKYAFR